MDFITDLPPVCGYDSILVVVDRMSKYIICIPTSKDVTSEALAWLLLIHVFSKHGFLEHITSDRGSVFISRFMTALGKILDIKLHFTAGYHPEADGQTKRMNQTLEQYLRVYCTYQQTRSPFSFRITFREFIRYFQSLKLNRIYLHSTSLIEFLNLLHQSKSKEISSTKSPRY